MLDIRCPTCARELLLPEESVQRKCQCPVCKMIFTPGDSGRAPSSPMLTAVAEHITEAGPTTQPLIEEYHDVEVLAERARYAQELSDRYSGETDDEYRTAKCKSAAKIGFGIGCVAGIATMFPNGAPDLCAVFWAPVALGLLASAHGLLIASFVYAMKPRHRAWVQNVLVGALVLWATGAVASGWEAREPLIYCLVHAVGTGLIVPIALGSIMRGIAVLARMD